MNSKQSAYTILIGTPFQYLSLLEYLHKKKIDKHRCTLIIFSSYKKIVSQIEQLGYMESFESVHTPMLGDTPLLKKLWRTYRLLLKKSSQNIIIGNLNNIWCVFLLKKNRANMQPVVLDDGAATIVQLNKRNNKNYNLSRPYLRTLTGIFQLLVLRPYKTYSKPLCFFTIFDYWENVECYDKIEVNKLDYIQQVFKNSESSVVPELWFISSPFTGGGLMSKKEYEGYVNALCLYSERNQLRFKYFCHKLEDISTLNNLGIEFVKNEEPFEVNYLKSAMKPQAVVGFYTTILFSLAKMKVPSKLLSIELDSNFYDRNYIWSDNTKLVYSALSREPAISFVNLTTLKNK